MLVLAWNFFDDIKKNNEGLSKNFINIKSLEKDNQENEFKENKTTIFKKT